MIPRARGGSSRQVEATNREHAVLTAKALDESKAIAARVQRRTRDERQLFRSRKYEERTGSHRCRLHEGVRRVNRRTLQIPRHRLSADQGGHPQGHRHPLLRDPGENAAGAAQDEAGRRRADVPDQHRRQAAEVAAQERAPRRCRCTAPASRAPPIAPPPGTRPRAPMPAPLRGRPCPASRRVPRRPAAPGAWRHRGGHAQR